MVAVDPDVPPHIAQFVDRFYKITDAGDHDAYLAQFEPDATFNVLAPRQGHDAILAGRRWSFANRGADQVHRWFHIWCPEGPNVAFVHGDNDFTRKDGVFVNVPFIARMTFNGDPNNLKIKDYYVWVAIYPGCVDAHGDSVKLSIPIQVDGQHLPPIRATVRLPPTYPDDVPPVCTGITCDWLEAKTLRAVQDKLPELFQNEPVLWSWWEWVGDGSFLSELGINLATLPPEVQVKIADFDADASQAEFLDQAYACGICFESKKGGRCVKLPCSCVSCQECIVAFWSLAIKEGAVDNVVCPSVECVKKRRALDAATVEAVVGPEATKRWQRLSEKRLVDRDKRYCFCPRELCEALVSPKEADTKKPTSTTGPKKVTISLDIGKSDEPKRPSMSDQARWDNYRQCGKCAYSFCYLCRALWHGAHTLCDIKDTNRAVREYLEADEEGKRNIEFRLGPRNTEALFALIRDYEREQEALKSRRARAATTCRARAAGRTSATGAAPRSPSQTPTSTTSSPGTATRNSSITIPTKTQVVGSTLATAGSRQV
ncbi:regulation of translational termination-related protein [Trichosporon asahii var. asahii CBS 8904]|uniref:Regulation of translational termination-related protein n=1 Tax=Trichosporon asahii var. asahii (strain CBS 8904) TaxID=1220162 RepID=K1VP06_TRIAC|nr:regulation of translational termination-related protein [Trichosporon asahii var. asahii CBS 8904]